MTAPTAAATGTARTARPGWLPPRWLVVAAVLVLAVVLTDAVSQAVVPFIRRDDWPFLLPPHTPFASNVYAKNLSEGRWLNWAWWVGIGQHSAPLTASLTYVSTASCTGRSTRSSASRSSRRRSGCSCSTGPGP
jgi:hypothetical protein